MKSANLPESRRATAARRMRKIVGFTLIELLVVIAIIGVLIALLLPAVQAAREAARRTQCMNNLKQIALATLDYENARKEFPPGRLECDKAGEAKYCPPKAQQSAASAFVLILPYLEEQPLYDMMDLHGVGIWLHDSSGWLANWFNANPAAKTAVETVVPTFRCPSDRSDVRITKIFQRPELDPAVGSYAFMMGTKGYNHGPSLSVKFENNGLFLYVRTFKVRHVSDGLSQTILAGEAHDGHIFQPGFQDYVNVWSRGGRYQTSLRTTENPLNSLFLVTSGRLPPTAQNNRLAAGSFGSYHAGGGHFAFGDGRVDFLSESIDLLAYQMLSTRDGGEVVAKAAQ